MNPIEQMVSDAFDENKNSIAQDFVETVEFCNFLSQIKINCLLEIGLHTGGSLNIWSKMAVDNATIIGIDSNPLPIGRCGKKGQFVHLIFDDSHDYKIIGMVKFIVELEQDMTLDFLFIDGDHSYEGCKRDFIDYGALVRNGGIVAFHDSISEPGVKKCVEEIGRFFSLRTFQPSSQNPRSTAALIFQRNIFDEWMEGVLL